VVVARGPLDVAAFERTASGRRLTFRASAGLQAVMNDEETGSDWSGDGEAVDGPLRGARLARLDGYLVEWHVWSAYHPDAGVYGAVSESKPAPAELVFPALTLPSLGGAPRAVPLDGALNLIVLWAAWCPSCATEMPRVQRLVERHAAQGLGAAGIAIHLPDDEAEKDAVKRFVKKNALAFPTFLVDEPAYDRLDALCKSAGRAGLILPTVFLTDAGGKVLSVLSGTEVETLPRVLAAHLKRPPAAP
jgi:thiol-disulfide isomerase/thioredoxin